MFGMTNMSETLICKVRYKKTTEVVQVLYCRIQMCLCIHIWCNMHRAVSFITKLKVKGWVRAMTVNDNLKSDLDIRYRAAVSDSEACLMPKLAWYQLALTSTYICVCVYLCVLLAGESEREYCNHHLLPYESCCSQWVEIVPWLFFPSALLWGFSMCQGLWTG